MYADIRFLRISFANIQRNKKKEIPRKKLIFPAKFRQNLKEQESFHKHCWMFYNIAYCLQYSKDNFCRVTSFEEQARSSELIQSASHLHKCESLFFSFFWELKYISSLYNYNMAKFSRWTISTYTCSSKSDPFHQLYLYVVDPESQY